MLWSGAMIYWANPAYWPTFPDEVYRWLGLDRHLADGLAYHFAFMWIFSLNGIIYAAYLIFSGEWRDLFPTLKSFREAPRVLLHDLGISKEPLPPGKFNAAQRIAYTGIIIMGFGSLATGLAIYKPIQLSWLKFLLGGYEIARLLHYLIAVLYVLFFLMHVLQVIRAGWNNFRAMVAGFEVAEPVAQTLNQSVESRGTDG
jgi:thiosulfate reductase cytochrome b subunit